MTEAPKRILVVEDEEIVSVELRARLEHLGYQVTDCVSTGQQAIAAADSGRPALVLMDIHLRGAMDGVEAADHIRRTFDIPVIYLTGHTDDATVKRAQTTEAFGYMLKPFDERELQVLIEMTLFRHSAQKEHERLLQERAARAAGEKERLWLQFLTRAGERLSTSLDLTATLQEVASIVVPGLADCAALHVKDEGTRPRALVARHAAGADDLMWALLREHPPALEATRGYAHVIRTGLPELLPSIDLEAIAAGDPERLRLLRALDVRALICVPLVIRGETFGALTLALAGSDRTYGRDDLDHAMALGRLCATAVDNARLYERAQSAIALRDEFLSVASHELRTPLASMVLAFQSIERGIKKLGDEPLGRKFGSISQQFDRLTELVERLLDVSRLSAGKLDIKVDEADLAQLAREVAGRFDEDARRAGSTLEVRGPSRLVGYWDRTRIEQILTNLIANALKFCSGKPVELLLEEQEGTVSFVVRDHGIGIPKEKLPHVFERFGRGVSARNYGGLGLGLYVTRQLVEAHGGHIRVASDVGEGTSFFVELPRAAEKTA
jgi:signal transduction histidine kinase